ncbi:hypothetical protein [Microbacterium sp. PRC9]|uniref:hypothetical protein n=1 Tax=Microbacterium sp. PRC9 TaxID=2962591 RepID=UPI0028826299|nr:hypothetical protein [Microbacterium sp. PRC9]MDT0143085.1 hypothetical protein [Microbacterium sp. PRC9]
MPTTPPTGGDSSRPEIDNRPIRERIRLTPEQKREVARLLSLTIAAPAAPKKEGAR